ncbi:protein farnesyltransferase NDAI_0B03130 [Naumovozyma dairenensis CBS 421]|uniref:Protein farnesyltransferase subunit beta n=1 Tax=Naumovozyma dairenensis (strain ATCC 10597 / BCRC 20456 / CBS 421 / NBRC 0211 / NRRL Y-12639) TaxID=1071378 RepID=G0W6D7_NAUDC|nr:hypothetical protein NDAI_0B03130 [Naumovozyma dairenensis CBS 421]CCD23348.1 hypothetical protein NDAI_0B03130 [Naumovozyma dairenensis CBS 421]
MSNPLSRAKFIDTKLLGRKRTVVEKIVSEEEIEPLMKELETDTTISRDEVKHTCQELFEKVINKEEVVLDRKFHRRYLDLAFGSTLPPQLTALDASQPWMLYWIANSLKVLDPTWLTDDIKNAIQEKIFKLSEVPHQGGPFGGGVGQLAHMAGTYASVNALAVCDNISGCWDKIDRQALYDWLLALKQPDGGFKTCLEVGEADTRGVYCALTLASLLNILTDELREGTVEYLVKCQNYEGGFGGSPQEDEAHGGYTFCAVASLAILNSLDKINLEKLMEWCSLRQTNEEGGLAGRSNKLVDGCYSFWVGATSAILESRGWDSSIDKKVLRDYILICCQSSHEPGLRDKPGKHSDFYHTMYILFGLVITENTFKDQGGHLCHNIEAKLIDSYKFIPSDLQGINPVYGLPIDDTKLFMNHFRNIDKK